MKVYSLFILLSLFSGLKAQSLLDQIMNQKADSIESYQLTSNVNQFHLSFSFSEYKFEKSLSIEDQLKDKQIKSIDVVYSAYKLNPKFDQKAFNEKRIKQLFKASKKLSSNAQIDWNFICQTQANSVETANDLWHGFVFHFKPSADSISTETEISFIKEAIEAFTINKAASEDTTPPQLDSVIIDIRSRWDDVWGNVTDTIYDVTEIKEDLPPLIDFPDSTVLKVFERNKNWSDIVMVTDVTASMMEFTSQLLIYFNEVIKANKFKQFVFFNDGNNRSNESKRMGRTGGIYHVLAKDFSDVLATMEKTMMKGKGGDPQENDAEAILKAMEHSANMDQIILLADNGSDLRDYDLIFQIDRPVKIIICENPEAVHPQYLMLARATKGSIHTLKHDVYDLDKLYDGENFKIGESRYKYDRGMFYTLGVGPRR